MRINELRLYGFKSFANKTVIKFDDNFIGIVGPNGSGKSNIIDAIRWVFGEQSSKSLRGKSNTDIIFGGTQTKKQANFAEVTLVLDNSDQHVEIEYNEVSITRRLYRSGDSEYLINNVECRLKDITDLFMDSGIGKNSFSIISQGKVEEIIVSKPEARRQVIEDISGVSKYKKRKEAALRKMERTTQNLNQVDIILSELNNQLVPLEKQANKAKEYKDLKERLEKDEVAYLANKIHFLNDDFKAYQQINAEIAQDLSKVNNDLAIKDIDLEQILEQENQLKVKLMEIELEQTNAQEEFYSKKSNYKTVLEKQKLLANNDNASYIASLQSSLMSAKEHLSRVEQEEKNLRASLNKENFDLQNLNQQLYKSRDEKTDIQSELREIKDQSKNNKYSFSVEKLINSNKFNLNVVRDLFNVNSEYAEAINVCLSARLNDVILPNMDEIKQAIDYLKKNKFGRATFINHKEVKKYNIDSNIFNELKQQEGFVDLATNLITPDPKFEEVFASMLNTTVVFSDIDSAKKAFDRVNKKVRIVTLNGEVFANNGTITGGKYRQVNPLLLKNKEEQLVERSNNLESEIGKTLELIKKGQANVHEKQIKLNFLVEQKRSLQDQVQRDSFELSQMDVDNGEISELDKELQGAQEKLNLILEQKNKIENQLAELNDKRSDLIIALKEANEELKILTTKENEINICLSKLEMQLSTLNEQLSQDYNLSYQLAYSQAPKNIDMDKYYQNIIEIKRKIKNLGIVNPDAIEEFEQIKERYDFLDSQRSDLISAMEKLSEIMQRLDTIVIDQFEDAYVKLRKEFKVIFSELFGGGQADLILTDQNDLLTTGIEIVAQPPGKKLQTISLLSGGEKALTAISLLFAVLRIKKVPFTILDEVEAALDEINVKRYANYIKIFSERTQFLVITHRQGTMQTCDSLYGITMVEKGISSVFKTTLKESEQLIS